MSQPGVEREWWTMDYSPITSDEEGTANPARAHAPSNIQEAIMLILLHDEFSACMYLEEVVRLSLSSRIAIYPLVHEALTHIKWMVELHDETITEAHIATMSDSSEEQTYTYTCLSCGHRPAVSWLGYDECTMCFDEH